jgi:hypothetical protein
MAGINEGDNKHFLVEKGKVKKCIYLVGIGKNTLQKKNYCH